MITSCLNLSISSTIKFSDMLNNIDKEIKCVSLKNAKLKWVKMQNFRKIAKLWCRKIREPQNRERYFMRDQLGPDSLVQFRNMYWLDWPKLKHIVEKAILNNYSISLYRDSFIAFIFLVFNTLFRQVLVTGITYFAKVRCLRAMCTCTSDRLHADSQWDHSIFYPKNSRITYDRNA